LIVPFVYCACGLRVETNLPIAGLKSRPDTEPADTRLCVGTMPPWRELLLAASEPWYISAERDSGGRPQLASWKLHHGAYLRLVYSAGADILMDRAGSRVWVTFSDSVTEDDAAVCLLGPILALVLRLRGGHCLHASAVAVGSRALALMGAAGAGKSTTAAAFAKRGFRILSDDVLAVSRKGEGVWIHPAHARLGLWPDAAQALFGSPEELPRLSSRHQKRYLDLDQFGQLFQARPLPLGAVYVLGPRSTEVEAPRVEVLGGHAGLMQLVGNAYLRHLPDAEMRARELELLGSVAASVPLRRVIPRDDPADLERLCALILDEFERVAGSEPALESVI
jgi:hypothetical protein